MGEERPGDGNEFLKHERCWKMASYGVWAMAPVSTSGRILGSQNPLPSKFDPVKTCLLLGLVS